MRIRRTLCLLLLVGVSACSRSSGGDTTIINQDLVPADPPVKAWRIPEMLGTAGSSSASLSEVRFDGAGNAFAIYMQNGIWARRWTADAGWDDPERISDSSPFGSSPKLTVDAAGNAIVVYSQLDDPSGGPETSIWWNRYVAGVGWGTADVLESADAIDGDVQIAGDPLGNAIAVWNTYDGISSSDILFNRYVAGFGWAGAAPLEDGPEAAGSARIGLDSSGNAIAVWNQEAAGSVLDIRWSRYLAGGGWTPSEVLDTAVDSAVNPEIAVNAAGEAIALWIQIDAGDANLWSASFRPASGWGAASSVETDPAWQATGGLQVGIDDTGAGTAAWLSFDGSDYRMWTARFSPAGGWTSVALLGTLQNGSVARLAVQPSGAAGIVWLYSDGLSISVLFSSHDGAGPWTPPEFVEFYDNQSDYPVLAFDPAGNAIAVWSYYDVALGFRVWANRFE